MRQRCGRRLRPEAREQLPEAELRGHESGGRRREMLPHCAGTGLEFLAAVAAVVATAFIAFVVTAAVAAVIGERADEGLAQAERTCERAPLATHKRVLHEHLETRLVKPRA